MHLYWTSLSRPKEIIPPVYLYYPKRVAASPYNIVINKGPSIAITSTAYGDGLKSATAGKLAYIHIQSRNEVGEIIDNSDDNYELHFSGPDGTTTGDFYITGVYVSNGLYLAQYVPQIAGVYTLTITLLSQPIKDSPFTVKIIPGEVSPANCITTLGLGPLTATAGMTRFFTITTYDVYNNKEVQSYDDTEVEILAQYVDHDDYQSPIAVPDLANWAVIHGKDVSGIALDRKDGTYASQFTIFRAGKFTLSIKISNEHVKRSPYGGPESDYLYITPSDIYAPNCVVKQVVTAYTAGTTSSFLIQGRDFYSNNIVTALLGAITDYKVEFREKDTGKLIHSGVLSDAGAADAAGPGVYKAEFSPTIAGTFDMFIQFNGLDVDSSPYEVTVSPAAVTSAVKTTIANLYSLEYTTGDYIQFIIESRDAYSNLRTLSTTDTYVVTVTGEETSTVHTFQTPTANNNGTYTARLRLTKAEPCTLRVRLGGTDVSGTPITGIQVNVGRAQAQFSQLVVSQSPLVAGRNYTFKIQAKDIFSNVATAMDDALPEMFDFELVGLDAGNNKEKVLSSIDYLFGLYEATFNLKLIG